MIAHDLPRDFHSMSVGCGIIGELFAVAIDEWRVPSGLQEEMVDRHGAGSNSIYQYNVRLLLWLRLSRKQFLRRYVGKRTLPIAQLFQCDNNVRFWSRADIG